MAPILKRRAALGPNARAKPGARVDRAKLVLLVLARIGLRAGEVIALERDDIYWRAGEMAIRGKKDSAATGSLPVDVGVALTVE